MPQEVWLSASDFAGLAKLTRRAATRIIASKAWRGCALETREVYGRGGRSGVSYEVSLRSVLEALGAELPELPLLPIPAVRPPPRDIASTVLQHDNRDRREAAILPFVYLKAGSSERLAALEAQAKATGYSVRSLNRWAALYVAYGVNGLANRKPANAGQRRVLVSRIFDTAFRAAGYQDELLAVIAAEVVQVTKGVWKSRREASGYNAVIPDVQTHMELICERFAVNLPASAFKLSRRRVEELAYFREVNKFRNNRKEWDDEKPRIRRDWTGLNPMDVVVADVKPLDIIVTRPDGSTAWPRIIGFHDAATFRLFVHVVLCESGRASVRSTSTTG